jgi:hypothetical protein
MTHKLLNTEYKENMSNRSEASEAHFHVHRISHEERSIFWEVSVGHSKQKFV